MTAPAVIHAGEIVWDNGEPKLVDRDIIDKVNTKKLVMALGSSAYQGDPSNPLEDESLIGKPCVEVMLHKLTQNAAAGNIDALKMYLEYAIGKPKQEVDTRNLNMTYQDFLEEIERLDANNT